MSATREKRAHRVLRQHMAEMQKPGVSATISAGGESATLRDPREICLLIAQRIETDWADIDKQLRDAWPADSNGDPVEFQDAELATLIATDLIDLILRFDFLEKYDIGYLYRFKENWEVKGKIKLGEMAKSTGLTEYYGQHTWEMKLNWIIWKEMTPWQKVALVYHELRHAALSNNGGPSMQGHHFEGFFDELELFGTKTYKDWARLAKAASSGSNVDVQYHLDFDE